MVLKQKLLVDDRRTQESYRKRKGLLAVIPQELPRQKVSEEYFHHE